MSAPWTHEVELHAEARSVALARSFVEDVLHDHELPHLVADVRLVVSELATNAIVHAATVFTVSVGRHGGERLVLEVRDGSRSGPVLCAPAALDSSGRGMAIVNALSRSWGVDQYAGGGKSVWAEFDA